MARRKRTTGRLAVFKGREAKLNRAIFHVLALHGPLTIYEICKEGRRLRGLKHTKYTNVNRRVRVLTQRRYLKKIGTRLTLAGFEACLHDITPRGYAALVLSQINLDRFIQEALEHELLQALAVFVSFA